MWGAIQIRPTTPLVIARSVSDEAIPQGRQDYYKRLPRLAGNDQREFTLTNSQTLTGSTKGQVPDFTSLGHLSFNLSASTKTLSSYLYTIDYYGAVVDWTTVPAASTEYQ